MKRAVVFDVDDTLYNQIEPFQHAIERTFPEIAESQNIDYLFKQFRFHSDEVFEAFSSGELSLIDMRRYRLNETLKDIAYPPVANEVADKFQEKYKEALDQIILQEDMYTLLNTLKEKDIPIGIITNGPTTHQWKKINQLNMEHWVDEANILVSESFGKEKPYPDIFKEMEKRLELPPEELIYVGDSFENDVVGGKSSGWDVVWINHRERPIPKTEKKYTPIEVATFADASFSVLQLLDN